MKVKIYKEEEDYPIYLLNAGIWGIEVEVPDELYTRYKKAHKEYYDIQDELEKIYDKAARV